MFVPKEPNWQQAYIDSGNDMRPNRQQAITWNIGFPVYCRIYASLRVDQLIRIL